MTKLYAGILALLALMFAAACSSETTEQPLAISSYEEDDRVSNNTEVSAIPFTAVGEAHYYVIFEDDGNIELRFLLTNEQQDAYLDAGNELFAETTEEVARGIDSEAVNAVLLVTDNPGPEVRNPAVTFTAHPGKPGYNIP